jgi:hypothetical protein
MTMPLFKEVELSELQLNQKFKDKLIIEEIW